MQESAILDLNDDFLAMPYADTYAYAEILIKELKAHKSEIEGMLTGYYTDDRGTVYDPTLEVDSVEFYDESSGCIRTEFNVNVYMGCKDMNYDTEEEMTIEFEIDRDGKTLTLTGEDVPVRGPDEF